MTRCFGGSPPSPRRWFYNRSGQDWCKLDLTSLKFEYTKIADAYIIKEFGHVQ